MSYTVSKSRYEFEQRIKRLRQDVVAVGRRNRQSFRFYDIILRATISEASAALEDYVLNVVEGWIYLLKAGQKRMTHVPLEVRARLVATEFENAFQRRQKGERHLLKALARNNLLAIYMNDSSPVPSSMRADSILKGCKYPSPENIDTAFFRLGIQSIFSEADRLGRRRFKELLKSFNDVRTSIAHSNPPDLTPDDACRHLDAISGFVRVIDRVLCRHLCRWSGRECWDRFIRQ